MLKFEGKLPFSDEKNMVFLCFFACFLHALFIPLLYGDRFFVSFWYIFLHEKSKHEKSRFLNIDEGFTPEVFGR